MLEDPHPSWLPHRLFAGSVPCHMGLSTGLLESHYNMAVGFPLTEQSQEAGKEEGSCNAFYDLSSEVMKF